jgi:hypothetical protein
MIRTVRIGRFGFRRRYSLLESISQSCRLTLVDGAWTTATLRADQAPQPSSWSIPPLEKFNFCAKFLSGGESAGSLLGLTVTLFLIGDLS